MNRHVVSSFLWFAVVFLPALPAQAVLNIRILDTTIPQNGTGFLDIVVSGNGDLLDFYIFNVGIERIGGPSVNSDLQFTVFQPDPQINDPAVAAYYVFNGVQAPGQFASDAGGPVYGATDRAIASVSVTTERLLSRIQLQHFAGVGFDASNDVYSITPGVTFFDNTPVNPLFEFIPGTVTVEATAVPEPSSIALLSLLAGGSVFYKRRRAKKLAMAV
jgi:hypothetical protein